MRIKQQFILRGAGVKYHGDSFRHLVISPKTTTVNLRVTTIQPLRIMTVGAIHSVVVDVFQSGPKNELADQLHDKPIKSLV